MPKESTTGKFSGNFHRSMDAKNRVTVPSDWLTEGDTEFFVLPAGEKLTVMPAQELARQEEELRGILPAGPDRHEALRHLYSAARRMEPDKQGRILIPDEYSKQAGLADEIVFAGAGSRFEIWNTTKWAGLQKSEEVARALRAIGLS